ncbi:MAG TPA: universal stress protein UspE [Psychromonas hadalis]|nr:universal stress protein UspE [Psychromonas hadalis]
MSNYKNILVYIDATQEEQPALSRAVELIKKQQNAKLTLLLCCYDLSFELTSLSSLDEREAMQRIVTKENEHWLKEIAQPYKEQGIEINTKVVWHNRPFQVAILEVLEQKHDLVVKSTHQHSRLSAIVFTPTDWHLLRKCPCPVLLVKNHAWPENGNILCALDCKSLQDEDHQGLNTQIIQEAGKLATLLSAKVHLVNAYPHLPMNIMLELPEFDPIIYDDKLQILHQKNLLEYADKYKIDAENTYLKQGLPEDVISDVAEKIDAELVILGTVGRSGLSAALLGQTAEQVIDSLNCDLLAIKPTGFVCPIKL